jgi:SAM-dependent methyltransferase
MDIEHQAKYVRVWNEGDYRRGSTAERMLPIIYSTIPESATINDYGCGTGRMELELIKARPEQKITMIDIAPNAPEDIAKHFDNGFIKFIIADLADLGNLAKADWGICINTLMVVKPEMLDTILKEIKRTCDNLLFEAYDLEDYRLGEQMTTVIKDKTEWYFELLKHWRKVSFMQSPESPRRYIFICWS